MLLIAIAIGTIPRLFGLGAHAEHRDDVEVIRVPYRGAASEGPRVAVVAPTAMPAQVAEIRREYPVKLATFKDIVVVSRSRIAG